MSHAANHYVKHLVTAPNGERITAPEKAVLGQLADDHREEVGFAWPSVGLLALGACLSERQCRRVLASIERKGIIQRLPTQRKKDGGQSSTEYVFVQLDPVVRLDKQALEENRRKLQKTPRSSATAPPGHLRPPRDSSRDSSREPSSTLPSEPNLPLPLPQAGRVRKTQIEIKTDLKPLRELLRGAGASAEDIFTGVCRDIDRHLLSTRPASGVAASGPDDWRMFRFGELAVVRADLEGDGEEARRVLVISSPDPPETERGLKKYKPTWNRLLEKWYKAPVELRVVERMKARTA